MHAKQFGNEGKRVHAQAEMDHLHRQGPRKTRQQRQAKPQREPSPTAYQVLEGETIKVGHFIRQIHRNSNGTRGYFTPDRNEFVPCEARLQLRKVGAFQANKHQQH